MPLIESIEKTADGLLSRLLDAADGLSPAQLDARPLEETSSLFILATHAISATEWNFVEVLAGRSVDRTRQVEFGAKAADYENPAAVLRERWRGAQAAIHEALGSLEEGEWERRRLHIFQQREITGWDVVCSALAHTAEHVGQAELTRQLLERGESSVADA